MGWKYWVSILWWTERIDDWLTITHRCPISDFSLAQFKGFKLAVEEHYSLDDTSELDLSKVFQFCEVHYQRSVTRVKSDYAVVPFGQQGRFQALINVLLGEETTADEFRNAESSLREEFEFIGPWLDFYFVHRRGECIFPAMKNGGSVKGYGRDNNGQEGTGRWVKRRCEKDRPNMEEALQHLFRECRNVDAEVNLAKTGLSPNYGKATSPKVRDEKRKVRKRRPSSVIKRSGKQQRRSV